jgi:hypothetical protein
VLFHNVGRPHTFTKPSPCPTGRGNIYPSAFRPPLQSQDAYIIPTTTFSRIVIALINVMVSVCTTCKGLQKHLQALDSGIQINRPSAQRLRWVSTTLPGLRRSTHGGCRACATLLQGVLLHHDRFAGLNEEQIRISAESFTRPEAVSDRDAQLHLSVEVRWQELGDQCGDGAEHEHEHEPEHEHEQDEGYPDLKLEFFTDGGMSRDVSLFHCPSSCDSRFFVVRA